MSSFQKLVRKFLSEPCKIDIDDVRRLLDYLDYTEKKHAGSECIFHKKGCHPINVPTVKGKEVKRFYVKRIVETLGLEEYLENNEGENEGE